MLSPACVAPPTASAVAASRAGPRRRRRRRRGSFVAGNGAPGIASLAGSSAAVGGCSVVTCGTAFAVFAPRGGRRRRRRRRGGLRASPLSVVRICKSFPSETRSAEGGGVEPAGSLSEPSERPLGVSALIGSLDRSSEEFGIGAFPRSTLWGSREIRARGAQPAAFQGVRSSRASAWGSSVKWSRRASAASDSGSTRA